MTVLLLALFSACTCSSPSAPEDLRDGTFGKVDLASSGASPVQQLWLEPLRHQATYELADTNLPAGAGVSQRVERPLGNRRVSMMMLPFPMDGDARKTIAQDLKISADGKPLKYSSMGGGVGTWRLVKERLEIKAPGAKTAVIEYARADVLDQGLTLSKSGKEPADFVFKELTMNGDTRQGLMLTTPSTVSWKLPLPKGARFDTTTTIDISPLMEMSDGLEVVLEVVDGDQTIEAGRTQVKAIELVPWSVDLSRWEGRTVELRVRTIVSGTPDHDYVFLGSPTITGTPDGKVRRVVVIGFDTTRPDRLGWYGYDKPTTPELDRIAYQSAVFTHAWTPAPRTRPSFRSATTGRNPLDAVGAVNIGEVFQQHGFATAGFVANIHLQPRFDFHKGFDTWKFDGQSMAHKQVDTALAWFEANKHRDSYMFLHIMDPHLLYHAPPPYTDMFVENPDPDLPRTFTKSMVQQWANRGELSDQRKDHIRALYDGELRFTSAQIGRLVEGLDALPGDTLIVFHSDHGEEHWEHGGFEHNHTLYDEVTKALLWVRPPKGTQNGSVLAAQPATLADIAPTLYDFAGFTDTPVTDGISLRPWLESKAPLQPRDIGIAHLRHGTDRWGVVHEGYKYIAHTGTGREELYKLPDEHEDLAAKTDLEPYRKALIGAHPGLDGGLGWRMQVENLPAFTVTLPQPARLAGVIDPDYVNKHRPNLAWGEPRLQTAEQVGTVTLSEDGLTLNYVPGPRPEGLLYVVFDSEVPHADLKLEINGADAAYRPATGYVSASGGRLRVFNSMMLVPPLGEAERMRVMNETLQEGDAEELCSLCELGYITGDACEVCSAE